MLFDGCNLRNILEQTAVAPFVPVMKQMKTLVRISPRLLFVMCAALVTSCMARPRQISLLPPIPNGVTPKHICVFRMPLIFYSFSSALFLSVDGQLIMQLSRGTYSTFALAPGRHTITVTKPNGSLLGMQTVILTEGQEEDRHYLEVNSNGLTGRSDSEFGARVSDLHFFESKNEPSHR